MARFQTVAKLRDRLGYANRDDINGAIGGVLDDTVLALEGKLRTKFDRVTVVDEFMVLSKNYGFNQLTRMVKLDLSRGFVDDGEAITVFLAAARGSLDNTGARVDLKDVDSPQNPSGVDHTILEDAERGRMIITDFRMPHQYVRVTYTSGFTTEGGDPDIYSGIPVWLQSLAQVQGELLAMTNPVLNPGVQSEVTRTQFEAPRITELRRTMEDALHSHVCMGPGYSKPIKYAATAVP